MIKQTTRLAALIIQVTFAHSVFAAEPVAQIFNVGGLCPSANGGGVICNNITVQLSDDGSCSGCKRQHITRAEIVLLKEIIANADFEALQQKKPGICPSAYDGMDTIYLFHTAKGDEKINACKYAIDTTYEPFKTLLQIINKDQ